LIHFYKRLLLSLYNIYDVGMPPLIRRPRSIPGWQLGLVVGIGVIAGVYVWRPVFAKLAEDKEKKSDN